LTDLYFFVTPTLLDADSAAPPEAQSTAPAPAQAKHRES